MAKATLSKMNHELQQLQQDEDIKKPMKNAPVCQIEHPPRGERADFLKITLTMPGNLLMGLKALGTKRRVAGQKDTDTSALVREALIEYLDKYKS